MVGWISRLHRLGYTPLLMLVGILVHGAIAGNETKPGAITSPYPTITNLAIEWEIEGDDNWNASCAVRFRRVGDSGWRDAMPLRRIPAGTSVKTTPVISWTNRLSGSLFDLEPDADYEIELTLDDSDGGDESRRIYARTRPHPQVSPNAVSKKLGPKELNSVRPGDLVLLADGDYGEVRFNVDGEPNRPIVYRSLSGQAVFREIGMTDRKWIYLEGVSVLGPIRMNGTEHCVVRGCNIRSRYGIKAYKPGMMNGCIEDNTIVGIHPWDARIMGANGDNEGEGVEITGSGNVIQHNRVSGFRDCLSHLEDSGVANQQCNDWLNNDISIGLDDAIEADFASSNCRFLRNRITNCFVGISSQPGLGGPNYFLRNTMFNLTYCAFKLHRYSSGDVILHNTVIKAGDGLGIYTSEPFDHAWTANNLFVGGRGPRENYGGYSPGRGRAVDVQHFGENCLFDFNAYGVWELPFEGKIRTWTFTKLPGTEWEPHGVQTQMDAFRERLFPEEPSRLYPPIDPHLNDGTELIDSGLLIPNLNDAFSGRGPDRGALELGQPAPIYGPRVR